MENSKGEFLFQMVSKEKGSIWATTGGHVKSGETSLDGIINEIKDMCADIIVGNIHGNYIDYNKVKNLIRDNLSKYLAFQTGNKPMIISVIQEI